MSISGTALLAKTGAQLWLSTLSPISWSQSFLLGVFQWPMS